MIVLKFGGTSVGSAQRMKDVASLICNGKQKIVVLSAMSGTTNSLVEISNYLYKKNLTGACEIISLLESKYYSLINDLHVNDENKKNSAEVVNRVFDDIRSFTAIENFTAVEEKKILAQGELLSTGIFTNYLHEIGVNALLIPALDFMKIDGNAEPDVNFIRKNVWATLEKYGKADVYITQGFICRNAEGDIDNLQRGGSDYTASLVGAAVKAEEIQIWTDIDGMHNNDPRYVENTKPVAELHFEEAAELAYFGAKILHPTCILPAKMENIPVRLLNTMDPKAPGTLISNRHIKGKIEAVAVKDGITAIQITSSRMLLAYGFLRKVFEVFEKNKTAIDMIATSEVGVSVSIDNNKYLEEIVDELKEFGTVSVDKNRVIICVVGDMDPENVGFHSKIINALKDIPIRMISFGGSNYNVSFLVKSEDKKRALVALSNDLF